MIEDIFRACEIILICIAAFVVGYVLFCAVCATVKAASDKIKKNRLKKFIKDNEKKAVPCRCGGRAYIEHRFGEFYRIGCTCCPVGFINKDISKLITKQCDGRNTFFFRSVALLQNLTDMVF